MRRALRITAWSLGGVLLLVVLVAAALLTAGNTVAGRAWLERTAATLTDGHVRLSGLAGSFPTAIDLEQLQLSDVNGPAGAARDDRGAADRAARHRTKARQSAAAPQHRQ